MRPNVVVSSRNHEETANNEPRVVNDKGPDLIGDVSPEAK